MTAATASRVVSQIFGLLLAVAMVLAAASTNVLAQSDRRICRNLEAQLTAGTKTRKSPKYARAAKRQRNELEKARRQARSLDCFLPALFRFGRGGSASQCRALLSTIDKMEDNLRMLNRKAGGAGLSPAQRNRVLASLEANGCRDKRYGKRVARSIDPVKPLRTLPKLKNRIIVTGPNGEIPLSAGILPGSYRTVCVRTCDGYYFPISYSAGQDVFARDSQICQAMCPGTKVELYVHSVPGQESEEMVSLDGRPYLEHPNALRYRSPTAVRDPSCTCNAPKNFAIVAGKTAADLKPLDENIEKVSPIPTPRPDPAADPEKLANRTGGLDTATVAKIVRSERPRPKTRPDSVRVVGPVFLPDPEGAIDLKAPARTSVR